MFLFLPRLSPSLQTLLNSCFLPLLIVSIAYLLELSTALPPIQWLFLLSHPYCLTVLTSPLRFSLISSQLVISMSTTYPLPALPYFWNLNPLLTIIPFPKSYLTPLTSRMLAPPLSLISLLFPQHLLLTTSVTLLPLSSSDHNAILLSVFIPFSLFRPYKPSRRHLALDINAINTLLSSIQWNSVLSSDLDSSWLTFK